MELYLDNSATTPVGQETANLIYKMMTEGYGNPSSLHNYGVIAEQRVSKVRSFILNALKVNSGRLVFTSGGTESNNLAIRGTAYREIKRGRHLITSQVEHPSVIEVFRSLESEGFSVSYLPVDNTGKVKLSALARELSCETTLVSVQAVNNELGTVQPLKEIGAEIEKSRSSAVFHSDAVQAVGKMDLYLQEWGVHLVSLSAHKFHGPKGIGGLYFDSEARLTPLFRGGGQEESCRPGTENVPGIVGMGKALEQSVKNREQIDNLYRLKQLLYRKVKDNLGENVILLGPDLDEGAPHVLSLAFYGVKAEVLIHALEQKGVYVSAGSACSSNKQGESYVLSAMEISREYLDGAIRLSFNYNQNLEDAEFAAEQIISAYYEVSKYTRG